MEPRIGNQELARFCRRLEMSLRSGIDARTVWQREAGGHGSSALKARMLRICDALAEGRTVSEAVKTTGRFFPPLVIELIEVGEETGNLAEVFGHLAEHYEHLIKLRRMFLAGIAWPVFQLAAAIVVIGILILVMGFLPSTSGESIDILGLGLTGGTGLLLYLSVVGLVAIGIYFLWQAVHKGLLWTRPLQRFLLRVPVFGRLLQILALSRVSYTMHLTLNTSLALDRALPLALRSANNAAYSEHADEMITTLAAGGEMHQAFADAGVFPTEFLDAVEVGERTGRLPESMGQLAEDYRDRAKRLMSTLTVAGNFAVFGLVGLILVGAIFLIASQTIIPYYEMVNELSQP